MKNEYKRKIGKYVVTVSLEDGVSIIGDYNSNFGTLYRPGGNQLFGMDWGYGLTETVKEFIAFAAERLAPGLRAKEIYREVLSNRLCPCFETNGGDAVYFEPKGDGFDVGTACNVGLLVDFHYSVDPDLSDDEILQDLYEEIEERYTMGAE